MLSLAIAGDKLFSGSYDYTVKVWNLDTLTRMKTLEGHTDAVRALSVADGRLFSGSYDSTVRVWDVVRLECLQVGAQLNIILAFAWLKGVGCFVILSEMEFLVLLISTTVLEFLGAALFLLCSSMIKGTEELIKTASPEVVMPYFLVM